MEPLQYGRYRLPVDEQAGKEEAINRIKITVGTKMNKKLT